MKNQKLFVIIVVLIAFAVFWKGCGNEKTEKGTIFKEAPAQMKLENREAASRPEEVEKYVKRGNVPITFYGMVTDENGIGLEGVSVEYGIRRGEARLGAVQVRNDRGVVNSGANGNFVIFNQKGSSLSVGPFGKDGYRDAQRDVRSFGYVGNAEPHVPDIQNPVQFVMVKEGTPQTKDVGHKTLKFAWNQGEVRIPLGNQLGDFILLPTRVKSDSELRDFDWSVNVSMDRAELVSLGQYHAAVAPSDGYQTSFVYGARKGDPEWKGGLQSAYAFKTENGLYGIARLVVYPAREDFVVNGSLSVKVNESGAKNLD